MTQSLQTCCLTSFTWSGSPVGSETTLAGNPTYTSGAHPRAAILVIADLFGWTFPNIRLLCDAYAAEANAAVYLPDFFGGEVVPASALLAGPPFTGFDHAGWMVRNGKEVRWPELLACARALRERYESVGVIGYCYGGWSAFRLGAAALNPMGKPLVDAISVAHPTWLTIEEVDAVGVPVQLVDAEVDPRFHGEVRPRLLEVVTEKGIPFDWQYFPGVEHAFATRGDETKAHERRAMVRAKRAQVAWIAEWLHGDGDAI